jgi:hypothetical protein
MARISDLDLRDVTFGLSEKTFSMKSYDGSRGLSACLLPGG